MKYITLFALTLVIMACGAEVGSGQSDQEIHDQGWELVTNVAGSCKGYGSREQSHVVYNGSTRDIEVYVTCSKGQVFKAR